MEDKVETKVCTECGLTKLLTEFGKNGNRLHAQCKVCRNKKRSEKDKANPEKRNEAARKKRAKRLEKDAAKARERYARNSDHNKAVQKIYREEHKEERHEYMQEYHSEEREANQVKREEKRQHKINKPTKICARCNKVKTKNNFTKDRSMIDGYHSYCRECTSQLKREYYAKHKNDPEFIEQCGKWKKEHPEEYRSARLELMYGITAKDYDELLHNQNGVCAICEQPETLTDRRTGKIAFLAVDHDHKTGKVRGLLCSRCNCGLGHFRDSVPLINKAATYLNRSEQVNLLEEAME